MNKSISVPIRMDYLDAVRAFALLLGIVFHASLSFVPIYIGWAVMDINTSSVVTVFMLISHSFRMSLFFFIAGFFSHMTFHKQSTSEFLKSKVVRLGIPFVIGWVMLRPLLVLGWLVGAESMRGDVDFLSSLNNWLASSMGYTHNLFTGTHLWFLYYLMLATGVVLIARCLLDLNIRLKESLGQYADNMVSWISQSPFALILLAVPTAACLWFMANLGIDTPDKSLFPSLPVLLIYTAFFLLGWLFHRQKNMIEKLAKLTPTKLVICLLAIVATVVLSDKSDQSNNLMFKSALLFSYALMMWSLIVVTIGVFKQWINRPNKLVRYIADSSYWLYLIHLPVVIGLQVAFAEIALHWSLKLLAISTISLLASIVLYDLLVRSTFIGKTLNGKRQPRVLFAKHKS
ncbi:acyltransferase family protein [Paraglaciecola aquimarina]|uniref:Acyltransferase family protein n=1 Tax=Paraglaciecola algarum TaxID=3050085 RepID=A0ABS9D760_9ALTE|nr:acyltransferase family protein [Paraglaciecola sp. G1-23]MCF2947857.1 acyltransferase family protein [Paraglaciecola sp. G1-23]